MIAHSLVLAERICMMPHADKQAERRNISDDLIRMTLDDPDRTYPGRDNKWVSVKVFGDRRIKAVWVLEDGRQVIITVADKYRHPDGRFGWGD